MNFFGTISQNTLIQITHARIILFVLAIIVVTLHALQISIKDFFSPLAASTGCQQTVSAFIGFFLYIIPCTVKLLLLLLYPFLVSLCYISLASFIMSIKLDLNLQKVYHCGKLVIEHCGVWPESGWPVAGWLFWKYVPFNFI